MVHYSCDCCGREMSEANEPRYIVRISASPGHDPDSLAPGDLDDDHVEAVAAMLQAQAHVEVAEPISQRDFKFDLCPDCLARYIKDPLNRDVFPALNFSKN